MARPKSVKVIEKEAEAVADASAVRVEVLAPTLSDVAADEAWTVYDAARKCLIYDNGMVIKTTRAEAEAIAASDRAVRGVACPLHGMLKRIEAGFPV